MGSRVFMNCKELMSVTFENAKGQLSEGKSNVLGRVEKFKELGINPKKSLRISE